MKRNRVNSYSIKKVVLSFLIILVLSFTLLLSSCKKDGNNQDTNTDATTTVPSEQTTTTLPEEQVTTTTKSALESGYGWVNTDSLHIRPDPSTDYEAIGGLAQGDKVEILGKEGDWYKIRILSMEGYVSAQYISASPVSAITTTTGGETTVTVAPTETTEAPAQ